MYIYNHMNVRCSASAFVSLPTDVAWRVFVCVCVCVNVCVCERESVCFVFGKGARSLLYESCHTYQ